MSIDDEHVRPTETDPSQNINMQHGCNVVSSSSVITSTYRRRARATTPNPPTHPDARLFYVVVCSRLALVPDNLSPLRNVRNIMLINAGPLRHRHRGWGGETRARHNEPPAGRRRGMKRNSVSGFRSKCTTGRGGPDLSGVHATLNLIVRTGM